MLLQVLSDGVFDSKYCMQELASAVNAGVDLILITKEGSRWPNKNGDMVEIFPPPELIESLEPQLWRHAQHAHVLLAAQRDPLLRTLAGLVGLAPELSDLLIRALDALAVHRGHQGAAAADGSAEALQQSRAHVP